MIEKAMFGDICLPADKKSRRSAISFCRTLPAFIFRYHRNFLFCCSRLFQNPNEKPEIRLCLIIQIRAFHRTYRMFGKKSQCSCLILNFFRLPVFLSFGKNGVDFFRRLFLACDSDDI